MVLSIPIPKAIMIAWSMVFLFAVLNVYGAFILKSQVQKMGVINIYSLSTCIDFFMRLMFSWQTILGMGLLFMAACAWMIALGNLELSRAYPVALCLNLLFTFFLAIFLYHEPISHLKIVGMILIVAGIIALLK